MTKDKSQDSDDKTNLDDYVIKDPEKLALNVAKSLEELGKAAAIWVEKVEKEGQNDTTQDKISDPVSDIVKTFSKVGHYWMSDPQKAIEAQTTLLTGCFELWSQSMLKLSQDGTPAPFEDRKDRRFSDPDWHEQPMFELIKNLYWVTTDWAEKLVEDTKTLDEATQHKAKFYLKQITDALCPTNFALTNPEIYKETASTNGENLVRGMHNLAKDMQRGEGELRISQVDSTPFSLGENIAMTPGKVMAENHLCQIIQYAPTTKKVLKEPLLICPPWINKFYILDLNAKKSFIAWAVAQGHTVFVISWVNPDKSHAKLDWSHYAHDGIGFALDTIEKCTGEVSVNAIGYCVGGTLLTATLALYAQTGDKRIQSATFFTSQVDFTHAGDLKVFADSESIETLEKDMAEKGYLDGSKMAAAFNMLRAADLIWPYVVNNYLKGKDPMPFDLLHWNSDSTRMAAANHSYYLRNCYLENNLAQNKMVMDGKTLNVKDVKIPVIHIAAKEDHISPPKSVYIGCDTYGGPTEFIMSGSGHVAGVINPPAAKKYQYWTGSCKDKNFDEWTQSAHETQGSWWPYWQKWVEKNSSAKVEPRKPGEGQLTPIEDAPGSFVRKTHSVVN